jgi:hypothetical protein
MRFSVVISISCQGRPLQLGTTKHYWAALNPAKVPHARRDGFETARAALPPGRFGRYRTSTPSNCYNTRTL